VFIAHLVAVFEDSGRFYIFIFVDMPAARYFCFAKSIYGCAIRYVAQAAGAIPRPTRPQGISRASAHIERKAHIANPTRDL